jgi:hypothetical protein
MFELSPVSCIRNINVISHSKCIFVMFCYEITSIYMELVSHLYFFTEYTIWQIYYYLKSSLKHFHLVYDFYIWLCAGHLRPVCAVWKKVKQSCYTPWRRLGKRRYSSYSFSTSALDGSEWSVSCPGRAFTTSTHWTRGWVAPEPVWTQRLQGKSFAPAGNRTPITWSSSP